MRVVPKRFTLSRVDPSPTEDGDDRALGAAHKAGQLAAGMFIDGPVETAREVRKRPARFGAILGGMTLLGAGAGAIGVDPNLVLVPITAGGLGFQMRNARGAIRNAKGDDKWRRIGSEVLWPTGVALGGLHASQLLPDGMDYVPAGEAAPAIASTEDANIEPPIQNTRQA